MNTILLVAVLLAELLTHSLRTMTPLVPWLLTLMLFSFAASCDSEVQNSEGQAETDMQSGRGPRIEEARVACDLFSCDASTEVTEADCVASYTDAVCGEAFEDVVACLGNAGCSNGECGLVEAIWLDCERSKGRSLPSGEFALNAEWTRSAGTVRFSCSGTSPIFGAGNAIIVSSEGGDLRIDCSSTGGSGTNQLYDISFSFPENAKGVVVVPDEVTFSLHENPNFQFQVDTQDVQRRDGISAKLNIETKGEQVKQLEASFDISWEEDRNDESGSVSGTFSIVKP